MRGLKSAFRWVGAILLTLVLVSVFLWFVALPSYNLRSVSRLISSGLPQARSVTISDMDSKFDYEAGEKRTTVLRTIPATAEQIASLHRATGGSLDFGVIRAINRCFYPRHRIEITRKDGTVLRVDVCFECSNMLIEGPEGRKIMAIPHGLQPRLKQFFTEVGMPPE